MPEQRTAHTYANLRTRNYTHALYTYIEAYVTYAATDWFHSMKSQEWLKYMQGRNQERRHKQINTTTTTIEYCRHTYVSEITSP